MAANPPLYLLDTNILVFISKLAPPVLKKITEIDRRHIAVPALVAAEMAYGVEKSLHKERNRISLEFLLSGYKILPWTHLAMWHYARQYQRLREAGRLIGHIDLLIAAQALSLDAVLVTNNTREFNLVEGLRVEDWTAT